MADKIMDVETAIQRQLESLVQSQPLKRCIYRVPDHLRKVNTECYQPLVVSIGPLYYQNQTLKSSHELKLRHLQCFLDLGIYRNDENTTSLGQYIDIIRSWENEIRSYYSEKISLSSDEFVEMVLIDAAFIIFLFMGWSGRFSLGPHPMDNKFDIMIQVHQDLFLEENQLPFFVLHDLYDIAFGETYPNVTFKDVTFEFIGNSFFPGREVARTMSTEKLMNISNIKHLVDLLRICCLPTKLRYQLPENLNSEVSDEFPPTAKELKAAGIKFMASESNVLLDVTFSNGVLHIPTLTIQDITEANLRSIVFFEQCHHFYDSYVIDYLFFLDALIHTSEDVQILVQHGIIKHWFGSNDDVATLFNRITKNLTLKNPGFYYAQVCQDLKEYPIMMRQNKWKAATLLRKDYFDQPLSIMVPLVVAFQIYNVMMK